MGMVTRVATIVMMLLFIFSAAVQYNDPGPWAWVAIYFAAALACLFALRGHLPVWLPWAVAGVAAVWAATFASDVIASGVRPGELVQEFETASPAIEAAREFYGLLLIAVWMVVLAIRSRGRRRA